MATTNTVEELPGDLLETVPHELADLYRRDSHFAVAVIFLPDLGEETESAHFTFYASDGKKHKSIGTLEIKKETEKESFSKKVMEVFNHPSAYSSTLADHISGRNKTPTER